MPSKPTASKLSGMLLNCRQDLERQSQQVYNVMLRLQQIQAENDALRRELGRETAPIAYQPIPDLLAILSRRNQAAYDAGMGRDLPADKALELIADIDTLIAVLTTE